MPVSVLSGPDRMTDFRNAALVIAHPGHELKVFGWLSESLPTVYVLTDGSGGGIPRLQSTAKLLRQAGAIPGELFGQLTDAEIYAVMLDTQIPFFLRIVDQLAASLVRNGIDFVAGDATEAFNPTHDVCRALVNAAVSIAQRTTGRSIASYEFCLTEWEQHCQEIHDERCWHLRLDDALLKTKLRAAADYTELKAEIRQAIASKGEEYFRIECLRSVTAPVTMPSFESGLGPKPYYEAFGEQRVAAGKYGCVIRYEQHMLPILRAVREYALRSTNIMYPLVRAVAAAGNR
jgi:hypothetical protein